jgi:hypothetical protein
MTPRFKDVVPRSAAFCWQPNHRHQSKWRFLLPVLPGLGSTPSVSPCGEKHFGVSGGAIFASELHLVSMGIYKQWMVECDGLYRRGLFSVYHSWQGSAQSGAGGVLPDGLKLPPKKKGKSHQISRFGQPIWKVRLSSGALGIRNRHTQATPSVVLCPETAAVWLSEMSRSMSDMSRSMSRVVRSMPLLVAWYRTYQATSCEFLIAPSERIPV